MPSSTAAGRGPGGTWKCSAPAWRNSVKTLRNFGSCDRSCWNRSSPPLRWQRRRLERAQAALIARRVQKLEIKRQRHSLQVSQETTEPIPLAQLDIGLIHDADSPTKFQKLLEWLEALKSMAEDGRFADWEILLKCVYGPTPTLRGGIVRGLFKTLMSTSEGAEPDRASLTALRRELEAEIANVTQQYHLYIRKHVE